MIKSFTLKSISIPVAVVCGMFSLLAVVYAANTVQFSLVISAGSLTVDIRSTGTGASVASPQIAFSNRNFSAGGQSAAGILPAIGQEIFVDNQDSADSGWTLSIAPTGSDRNATWVGANAATNTLTINSPTGGLLTVDPSAAVISSVNPTGVTCNTDGVSRESSANFTSVDSITLLTATSASDDICQYTLSQVDLTQTIPANQAADSYSLGMTLTTTAS